MINLKATLKKIKLHESTISMILGAVVIMVTGVLLINFFSRNSGETIPPVEISEQEPAAKTHTVSAGENLWSISEQYYGTGYNWVDIAQANNLKSPDAISEGQKLTIPSVAPRIAEANISPVAVSPAEKPKEVSPTLEPTETIEPNIPPTQPIAETKHTVAEGENLWKIAENYYKSGYNWVDISKFNNLVNPNHIEVGQELIIPLVEPRLATVAQISETVSEPISGATYTVQKGDNLWNISVRAYGDGYKWIEIAKANNLQNPNLIHSGNILSIPR